MNNQNNKLWYLSDKATMDKMIVRFFKIRILKMQLSTYNDEYKAKCYNQSEFLGKI